MAMTKMPFDSDEEHVSDQWTTGRLIDELFMNLESTIETDYVEDKPIARHRYYDQASGIINRISEANEKHHLLFEIYLSDLSEKVRKELVNYYNDAGEVGFIILLKHAIRRIFDNLDPEYRHISTLKNLKVKFIE